MPLLKIISGGQTGVDRAALDAALAVGFPCGGWCPPGRAAEDGEIPIRYPVVEMPGGGYRQRTIQNVCDSDATLIIYFDRLRGGTEQTVAHCIKRQKPYKLIDGSEVPAARAADLADRFIDTERVASLNVAGPRESQQPEAYSYVLDLMGRLISLQSGRTRLRTWQPIGVS